MSQTAAATEPVAGELDSPAEFVASPSDESSSEFPVLRRRSPRASSSRPSLERVWSAEMLSHIPWAAKFFSGPKDPSKNKFSAYCHICQMNISVKTKGHYAIVRHWRRERHFRREQLYRYNHGMDVLDRQMRVLTGHKLEMEKEKFDSALEVTLSSRNPYYGDSMEDVVSLEDSSVQQLKIQLRILLEAVQKGEQLSSLKSVWRIVTAYLPHNEVLSEVDFSEARVVCLIQYLFNRLIFTIAKSIESDGRYGINFVDELGDRDVHLIYWDGNNLRSTLLFIDTRLTAGDSMDMVTLSRLFTALPKLSLSVSCTGVQVEVIKTLDNYFHPRAGVLSSFKVDGKLLERLIVKPENLVFGRVDAFSIVEYILARLRGASDEEWLHQAPTLYQVSSFQFQV